MKSYSNHKGNGTKERVRILIYFVRFPVNLLAYTQGKVK